MRIGLTGISTCGKSTISRAIQEEFKCPLFEIDEFYKGRGLPMCKFHGKFVENWDDPQAILWDKYYNAISSDNSNLSLIDCFQIRYDKRIENLVTAIIQFNYGENDLPTAVYRRVMRLAGVPPPENYHDLDPFEDGLAYEALYFEDIVWPIAINHPEYWKFDKTSKPILFLNATDPLENNIQLAKDFVHKLFDKK